MPASQPLKSTGSAGPVILSIAAAIWAIAGLNLAQAQRITWLAPAIISAAIIAAVLAATRHHAPPPAAEEKRIGRLVGIWSGVEGVAIFLAINLCANLNRTRLIAAAICLIVGLHFVPLAKGLPVPAYYLTAALMTALGLAGILASAFVIPPAVALGAAAILWGTLGYLLLGRRAG